MRKIFELIKIHFIARKFYKIMAGMLGELVEIS